MPAETEEIYQIGLNDINKALWMETKNIIEFFLFEIGSTWLYI